MSRGEVALIVGSVLGYITGLSKAILTPVENIFFGFPNLLQVAVFVALITLGVWVAVTRLSGRRRLFAQARDLTSG